MIEKAIASLLTRSHPQSLTQFPSHFSQVNLLSRDQSTYFEIVNIRVSKHGAKGRQILQIFNWIDFECENNSSNANVTYQAVLYEIYE